MAIIESEQSKEVKLTDLSRGPFVLRFLSYRKSEDAKLNLRSEDYIVSELNNDKAIFVLCDGVGSSFYGNIGSQILGETVLKWLSKIQPPNIVFLEKSESIKQWIGMLTNGLTAELKQKTVLATSIIQKKNISNQDELSRLAETTQRDDFGTQSNFACCVAWPKSSSLPNGLIILFWLGNARLRIFQQQQDLTPLLGWGSNPDQLKEVWSSKDGVVGYIYSYITTFSKVSTVIAYSDGLENSEDEIYPGLTGTALEKLVRKSQSIKDDDATFLELSVIAGEVPGVTDDVVAFLRNLDQVPEIHPVTEPNKIKQTNTSPPQNSARSSPNMWVAFSGFSVLIGFLCFFLGLLTSPVVAAAFRKTATPTLTLTATSTLTLTPSVTSSTTPTASATFTETPTVIPSTTETPTLLPTATDTIAPTYPTVNTTLEATTPPVP